MINNLKPIVNLNGLFSQLLAFSIQEIQIDKHHNHA